MSCILHVSSLPDYGIFTPFSRVHGGADDRLAKLQTIRNRRLCEPLTSNYRMKEVCNQIPEDLDDVDMDNTGYYRQCYQRFTANLHLLTRSDTDSASTYHHSPRKCHSTQLFPLECIFCGKLEIKSGRKTERTTTFVSWKNWETSWRNLEIQALEKDNVRLHRQVKGVDLVAVEAKYHSKCRKSLNTAYRYQIRAKK